MTLSIKETLQFAWAHYKPQAVVWLKIIIAALIVSGVSSFIAQSVSDNGTSAVFSILLNIADFFVQIFVAMAMIFFAIRLHDGKEVALKEALTPMNLVWGYIGASIIFGFGVIFGLVLLIIPGILFAIAGSMWPYAMIDKQLGPIAAMKESWRITKGNRWRLFLLGIVLAILNIIGLIPLGLGLLITVPISTLAIVHAYRFLEGKQVVQTPVAQTAIAA